VVKNILSEYKIHNADILIHDDSTVDDFIDIVEGTLSFILGNRKYVKCLYCYNKIDTISMEEVNMIASLPTSVVISCNMKLNFDGLLEKIWELLDLVRVYTKKAHDSPDFGDPIVLTNDRNGCSVKSVCEQIHRDLPKEFKYAKVW
jgi:ribosome-interacting GTPase 1